MCWRPQLAISAVHTRGGLRGRPMGFTLLELMVGIFIGLLATLAVTQVLVAAQGQNRAATAGSDAQVNGALALATLQGDLVAAGYGFTETPGVIGCALAARVAGGSFITGTLAPVVITDGASDAADTIRILASGKRSYAVPLRLAEAYAAGHQNFKVVVANSVQATTATYAGDLMLAAVDSSQPCEVFRVNADVSGTPPAPMLVPRLTDTGWNEAGFPANAYTSENFLINMGMPVDVTYSITTTTQSLDARTLRIATDGTPSYEGPVALYPNIVNMQALYGKDTNDNGSVDRWDSETPITNAGWLEVVAVRVAVVARSTQYEKEDVTNDDPLWKVGSAVGVFTTGTTSATIPCGSSACIKLKVNGVVGTDWRRYRYKVFETVVPLRNMLWRPTS
jgi:type IV pilus assembly protein PilW